MGRSSWWVHLPGTVAIASMIAVTAYRRPWPLRAPIHFDLHWNANRWGSPWAFAIFPLLAAIILISQIIVSAMWKKHEDGRKRFNLTLPLMAAPLGAMTGVHLWYWTNLPALASTGRAAHPWEWVWACTFILVSSTILIELLRRPNNNIS
jgi:hypothetical protein